MIGLTFNAAGFSSKRPGLRAGFRQDQPFALPISMRSIV